MGAPVLRLEDHSRLAGLDLAVFQARLLDTCPALQRNLLLRIPSMSYRVGGYSHVCNRWAIQTQTVRLRTSPTHYAYR